MDIEIADGDKDSSDSDSSSDSDAEVQELEAINVGEGRDSLIPIKKLECKFGRLVPRFWGIHRKFAPDRDFQTFRYIVTCFMFISF